MLLVEFIRRRLRIYVRLYSISHLQYVASLQIKKSYSEWRCGLSDKFTNVYIYIYIYPDLLHITDFFLKTITYTGQKAVFSRCCIAI